MRLPWVLVLMAACGEPARSIGRPATPLAAASVDLSRIGRLEGRVLDSKTGRGVVGINVTVSGPCKQDPRSARTYSDQNGSYRLEVPEGDCMLEGSYGDAHTGEHAVRVDAQRTAQMDLVIDHDALAAALAKEPPQTCSGSNPGEVVLGSLPSQKDLDAIARAVIAEGGIPDDKGDRVVRAEVADGLTLTRAALPAGYVLETKAQLEAKAKRANGNVWFIAFERVYATKTCAYVTVGGNFEQASGGMKHCCCSATDFYEKRKGTWRLAEHALRLCL